jgi:hypothetical protein
MKKRNSLLHIEFYVQKPKIIIIRLTVGICGGKEINFKDGKFIRFEPERN